MLKRMPLLLLLPSLLLLNACQGTPAAPGSTPTTSLQTFDALYASAVSADDLVVRAASVALATAAITSAQAHRILAITDAVKTALDAANAAAQLGNLGVANGNLAQAMGPIVILSACLTTKPLTVQTFNNCAAKLAPPTVQS
jgi:hypothetical protein